MRLLLILVVGLFYASTLYAAENTRENTREKTREKSQSWLKGVWDEKRIARHDGLILAIAGQSFLLGENIDQDSIKAEILFKAAAKKNPKMNAFIGIIYHTNTQNRLKTLDWFFRAVKTNDLDGRLGLGVVMWNIGLEIIEQSMSEDSLNTEGLAWIMASSKYGYWLAKEKLAVLTQQISAKTRRKIEIWSKDIISDPVNNYRLLSEFKIAPNIIK